MPQGRTVKVTFIAFQFYNSTIATLV